MGRMRTGLLGVFLALGMGPPAMADDPLLRPIAPDYAKRFLTPAPPVHVFGNTYMVGFGSLSVAAIRTSAGVILLDGALPQAVGDVEAHLAALGLSIRDVKLILSTEPHYDHAGGLAALERDSGATIVASAAAAKILRARGVDPADPQAPDLAPFPAPRKIRTVRDGESFKLGDVTVKAIALPGHTPGSMGWTWTSCEGRRCVRVVFAASINAAAADGYRFSDPGHQALVAQFRASAAKLRALPCDLILTSHPEASDGPAKLAIFLSPEPPSNPYLDAQGCAKAADGFTKRLEARLASEVAGK